MLLGHNFSPQSKFFVVENRGKAVAIFLQRNEKIGEKQCSYLYPLGKLFGLKLFWHH